MSRKPGEGTNDLTEAAVAEAQAWLAGLEALAERIGLRFARSEARQRAGLYLKGLLSPVERKNGWQLAEAAGDPNPYRTQHLLGRADWDADEVRDDLHAYVREHLGDRGGVLIVDETGFLKKGTKSVGVQRQYAGTAGKIENCQVGVFLAWTTARGRTLIDRALYLPESWARDRERRAEAGVPESVAFATKPQLARRMLERALGTGFEPAWVLGDAVYGDDRRLRIWLEQREQPYVLAVSGKEYVWLDWRQQRVKTILAGIAQAGWKRLSAGHGSKGERFYDWTALELSRPMQDGFCRLLLVRRSLDERREMSAYVVFARLETRLTQIVRAAGARWAIEECFETAKGEVGLDQYEVRSWPGWHRHITLAMLAHAYLTVTRAHAAQQQESKKGGMLPATTGSLRAFKRRRNR
jgi:SRSO17 transposase